MLHTRHLVVLFIVIGLSLTPAISDASTRGSPEISVFIPDNRVLPGEETTLGIQLLNGGDVDIGSGDPAAQQRVTTARDMRVEVREGDAPIEVTTTEQPVGNVPEGVSSIIGFDISVDEDAAPGEYRVPVHLEYRYTHLIASNDPNNLVHQESEQTETQFVTIIVEDDAQFTVDDATLIPGFADTGSVELTLTNTGSAIAHDAQLSLTTTSTLLSFDGVQQAQTFIGNWHPDEQHTLSFDVQLADGADRRSYPLTLSIDYDDDRGEARPTDQLTRGVTPGTRASPFRVTDADVNVAVGDSGPVQINVIHTGNEPISDAVVTLQSLDETLTFGESTNTGAFIGDWNPGEHHTISFTVSIKADADVRPYPVSATIQFKDEDGEITQSDPIFAGLVPRVEQSFDVTDITSTLTVGEEGIVEGQLVNSGNTTVTNAVLVFNDDNQNIVPIETEYSVGTLNPDQGQPFSFDIEISESAASGPRQLSMIVRYRNTDGDIRRSDPIDVPVEVRADRDTFSVEPIDATIPPGGNINLQVRVTNQGDEPVTDISAKLFTSDPLSSGDSEAFITRLEPGESEIVVFDLSAGGGALQKVYPAELDFQYDNEAGDTLISDTYRIPVPVAEASGGSSLPLIIGVIVLVAIAAGGYLLYQRRQQY